MSSKCISKYTTVGLEGGEFILHPQAEQILDYFHVNHPNYTLLSNGLYPKKVCELARRYKPKRLYLSLDGGNEQSYSSVRGVNGYENVIKVIEEMKGIVPISIMFCLTPWNTLKDMDEVIGIALKYDVDIRIGIYATMEYFDVQNEFVNFQTDNIPNSIHKAHENFDFVKLYAFWRKGELFLPCQSIKSELVIHDDGTVPICQNLDMKLGDIHENSLDEIFNSRKSCKLQSKHYRCNKCWINFHRKYDICILRNLEYFVPKKLLECFFGKYQWCTNSSLSYKKVVNEKKDV